MIDDLKFTLIVSGISLPLDCVEGDAYFKAKNELIHRKISVRDASFRTYRIAIDARKRENIRLVYSVAVTCYLGQRELEKITSGAYAGIAILKQDTFTLSIGEKEMTAPPVVVGSGPAGLFCALMLARNGYRPILLERGGSVVERTMAIDRFFKTRHLDIETNVQFGAGGAGTFSDGKLVTRVNDPLTAFVFDTFIQYGAPQEIAVQARPHIGTDLLCGIVDRMLKEIENLGGSVLYHTCMERILVNAEAVTGVVTNRGEIAAGALVLAIGHSARDTYANLMEAGLAIQAKPFSVGVRVEHLQSDIDEALYGRFAGHPALGHAEYHLSHNTAERGVYSFCMCPGGTVVAAASEEGGVVVNGMSRHARDGVNANSAIAVSVNPSDFGDTPAGAIAFQRTIERAAFAAGGGDFSVPLMTMGDFLGGTSGTSPSRILPTYGDGKAYRLASPDEYLPAFATKALREAMGAFERKIRGFSVSDALLSGAETRTSAPVRLLRSHDTGLALGYRNLYPAGEGAGYAGGITSAALDGIHTARALMTLYAPY